MAITFSIPDTEIIVTTGQVEALIQNLVNACREFEDEFQMMGQDHIIDAEGKAFLSPGVFTEIVMTLRNPWTIRFEDEATDYCAVRGGSILALDGVGAPRPVSTNPGLTINQSVSGVLLKDSDLYGGKTFDEVMEILLAMAQGRMERTDLGGGLYRFDLYEQDNLTILYSYTLDTNTRTRL